MSLVTLFALFDIGERDTLVLWQSDVGFLAVTNHENVGETGGEGVATSVLNVSDFV